MIKTHGETGDNRTTEYRTWDHMIQRCYNVNNDAYINYGFRGITVCDRWLTSFENFLLDMGRKPTPKHSIERKDNNGNYEKDNCKWATVAEQKLNTTRSHLIEYKGQTKTIKEWSDELGIDYHKLFCRFWTGMSVEKALTKP